MAALNKTETENLRDVQRLIDLILEYGYDPQKALANIQPHAGYREALRASATKIRGVVSVKGYFPC